jgi:peptide/nickel transport system substrate-binding protein
VVLVSKYIRWQALLTLLGIVLVGTLLMRMNQAQGAVVTPETASVSTPSVTKEEGAVLVPVRGGTFVEGVAGAPQFINPLFSQLNDVDRDLCSLIFEGLTTFNERNQVVPLLAERWDVSEDGLTYTFRLRDSVRWQDGEPLTADDVVFTIGLFQSPDFPGLQNLAELWRLVEVKKLDTYVVQFTLLEPYAPFINYTTVGLVPKHILEDVPVAELLQHEFNYYPVGTGLFKVEEHTAEHIVLGANPYHRLWTETMLDHIELKFYPGYENILTAYGTGEVMGVSRILAEDLERARAYPDLQILAARLSGYSLIFLNLNNPDRSFFQDLRVRQALLYGLDRQRLIDAVLGGQGLVIDSPILPQSWAYNPDVRRYPYDPRRAVSLLEEAGWLLPDPGQGTFEDMNPEYAEVRVREGLPLEFTLVVNDVQDRLALAHAVAEQWQAIGVRVQVEAVNVSELTQDYLQPRAFDAVLLQWQVNPDPDPYPMWHSTQTEGAGQNYSGFVNRDADEAIEVARLLSDPGKRAELYHQFQAIFAEQVPALLLYQPIYAYGVDKRVRNVQIAPMLDPSGRFKSVYQWAVLEQEIPLPELNDRVGDKLDKQRDPWYDFERK